MIFISFTGSDNRMECDTVAPPTHLSYISMFVSLLLSIVTIPGNALVLFAVYKDPYRELRKPFTVMIASLALADLTAGAITDPMAAYFMVKEIRGGYVQGFTVYLTHLSYVISCTTSVLTLGLLSLDRYLAISHALWYKAHFTLASTIKICIFVWLISVALSLAYIKTGFIHFAFVFANTAVLSTACVLAFSYSRIFKSLRNRTRQIGVMHEGSNQHSERQKSVILENKLTKLYLLMLGVFLLCFVPSCSFIYVMYFCSACDCVTIHWLRDMSFLLVLTNSSLNPVLYSLKMKRFRKAFVSIINCSKEPQRGENLTGEHTPGQSTENPMGNPARESVVTQETVVGRLPGVEST